MTREQAAKQAAKLSKSAGPQFVVWVFDHGREVFDAEQARIYAPLIDIEAAFVAGVEVSAQTTLEVA